MYSSEAASRQPLTAKKLQLCIKSKIFMFLDYYDPHGDNGRISEVEDTSAFANILIRLD